MTETIKHEEIHEEHTDLAGNTVVTNEAHTVSQKQVVVPSAGFSLSRILGVIITILILAGLVALVLSIFKPKVEVVTPDPATPDISTIQPNQPNLIIPPSDNPNVIQPAVPYVEPDTELVNNNPNPLVAGLEKGQSVPYTPVATGASTTTISFVAGLLAMATVFFLRRRKSLLQN